MSALLFSIALFGCSEDPTINGTVKDIWDRPVEGAMIQMEGDVTKQKTDSSGNFSFVLSDGKEGTLRFRAGHEEYIHDVEVAVYSKDLDKDKLPNVRFKLYPKPATKGFYGIGKNEYVPLKGEKTKRIATKLEGYEGLVNIGSSSFPQATVPQFVFYSSLRNEEIKQIDLQLFQLEFKEKEELKGVLGETDVEIDLWLPKEEPIDFTVRTLDQKEMYLLEFKDKLPAGVYAFASREVLGENGSSENIKTPKELKLAYPFEIK